MLAALILLSVALGPAPVLDAPATGPARPQAYSYYLVGLEVTGAKRLNREQVIALSGLKTRRSVTSRDLAAASARLVDAGLFAKVGYRTRITGDGYSVVVTFDVEDLPWSARVFFDNFVEMTDAQLTNAVAAALPTFAGSVPVSPAALERVRLALVKAAADAGQPGTVNYILIDDELLGIRHYRYRLERAAGPLRVCSVAVDSSVSALRDNLTARTGALVGGDFSRDYVIRYAMQNLLPTETSQGYLRARVRDIQATRTAAGSGACAGVNIAIALEDGAQYRWQGATWNGATLFSDAELDRLVGLRPDEPADGVRIANAGQIVRDAYATRGHVNAGVQAEPSFDEGRRQVAYAFRINEGPEFRMGALRIEGLPVELVERVTRLWELAEGDVFDQSYLAGFTARARVALRAALGRFPAVQVRATPDARRLAVDVVITVTTS